MTLPKVSTIDQACCVLHNLCIDDFSLTQPQVDEQFQNEMGFGVLMSVLFFSYLLIFGFVKIHTCRKLQYPCETVQLYYSYPQK